MTPTSYNYDIDSHVEITTLPAYQLLTGNYSSIDNIDQLISYIWSTSTLIRASMNTQVKDSGYAVSYLSNELCNYLASELEGKQEISEQVFKEYENKVEGYLKEGFLDVLTGVTAQYTNVIVTQEVFDNIRLGMSFNDSITSLPGRIDTFENENYYIF